MSLRVTVRVQAGASRTSVGGRYADIEPPVLMVRVTERAVDGKANEAVAVALAQAFEVPRRAVTIVSGQRSRSKLVQIDNGARQRLATLLER